MNQKKYKISYDKESNVLSIAMKSGKSVDSDIRGNVVIDYDKKGDIVRVNVYGFRFDAFRDAAKALKAFSRNTGVPLSVR